MKVAELIEMLEKFDGDMEVMFARNSGDYWRTTVADSIGEVTNGMVVESAYHQQDKIVDERDGDDVSEAREVVIISR